MSLDTTTLQTSLTTRIASLTGSESPETLLALTAALDSLTTNRMLSVATTTNLPNLITNPLPSGSLVFVEEYNIMMMSVGSSWKGIDGRGSFGPQRLTYAWGRNAEGRLGDNTISNRSSPVTVVGGIKNWRQVSSSGSNFNDTGGNHSLGVTVDGIAYAWGRGTYGRLGDNNTSSRLSPVTVVGGITNWLQLSAGFYHSLGVTSTGIAYGWGSNSSSQLGAGPTVNQSSPVTIVGGITNWKQVTAGKLHSLGATLTGIAYAWGYRNHGRLGDGISNTTATTSPVTVVGGITNWFRLNAAFEHSLGVTSTGIAYAWGRNTEGRLGNNNATNQSSPVTVVGGITTWSQVSGSYRHSLGVTSTGIAYGWGYNLAGRLGDNTGTTRSSPVTVVGGITNWSQVEAGGNFSIGLTNAGIAYAWGTNGNGQLGDNTTSLRSSPVTVVGGITTWAQVAAGIQHSLAIFAS